MATFTNIILPVVTGLVGYVIAHQSQINKLVGEIGAMAKEIHAAVVPPKP